MNTKDISLSGNDSTGAAGYGEQDEKDCSISSVKSCLDSGMHTEEKGNFGYQECDENTENKNCSMQRENPSLRYEMKQLGKYVSILEFDMAQRFYRYLDEYQDRRRAKVMEHLRVMVFIHF